jgi:hypothetical protein
MRIVKDNIQKLAGKNAVIFVVGASSFRENILDEIKSCKFSVEEQKESEFYYLWGFSFMLSWI